MLQSSYRKYHRPSQNPTSNSLRGKATVSKKLTYFIVYILIEGLVSILAEMTKQTLFKFRKSQVSKFLGTFCYRKSANFLGVPVRKSANFHDQSASRNPQSSTKYFTTLSQNSPKM